MINLNVVVVYNIKWIFEFCNGLTTAEMGLGLVGQMGPDVTIVETSVFYFILFYFISYHILSYHTISISYNITSYVIYYIENTSIACVTAAFD